MKFTLPIILILIAVVIGLIIIITFISSVSIKTSESKTNQPDIDDFSHHKWEELANKTIFFGHKSVGYNILDGITLLSQVHNELKFKIIETSTIKPDDEPMFAHSQVGENMDPISKIVEFKELMDSGLAEQCDIAFFKFCYADIFSDSNPKEIFEQYRKTMDELIDKYPDTQFVHVTIPLMTIPPKAKSKAKFYAKKILGKDLVMDDNRVRQEYNTLLINYYKDKQPIFDLAKVESTNLNGSSAYKPYKGLNIPMLVTEYTYDGGHLNELGQKVAAEQLLITLLKCLNN